MIRIVIEKEDKEANYKFLRKLKRIPLNILSNGIGYTFMWIIIILLTGSYKYFSSPISEIIACGLILGLVTYGYWKPEGYLHQAAGTSNIEDIKKYLEKGGNINIKSITGNTALIIASAMANPETVSFLIDNGADVNAVDYSLYSSLPKGSCE
ncbi:MAG: ankyrin repeat domain-containing protein [Cyanobacteria bacterium J06643_5]